MMNWLKETTINGCGENGAIGALESFVPQDLMRLAEAEPQRSIPAIANNSAAVDQVEATLSILPNRHDLHLADARLVMKTLADDSCHLVMTSPPYWNLKRYEEHPAQLGHIADYSEFLESLRAVWEESYRVLVPGGRLAIVVGDVCLSRRRHGRHVVVPLHAGIIEMCRALGFDNLAPIIWHKIGNANHEVSGGSSFFGKPYEPNAVIKNDIEFILFQRKPGGYRKPSLAARILSVLPASIHAECFQQVWTLNGASTKKHPAPFPEVLAERLIRMFSFVGDTVLDPFAGTGTTNYAAGKLGRNSIGIEVEPRYFAMAKRRVTKLNAVVQGAFI